MTSYIQKSRFLRFYDVKNSETIMSKTFYSEPTIMVTQITNIKKQGCPNNL